MWVELSHSLLWIENSQWEMKQWNFGNQLSKKTLRLLSFSLSLGSFPVKKASGSDGVDLTERAVWWETGTSTAACEKLEQSSNTCVNEPGNRFFSPGPAFKMSAALAYISTITSWESLSQNHAAKPLLDPWLQKLYTIISIHCFYLLDCDSICHTAISN